jgi:hypothetical protein
MVAQPVLILRAVAGRHHRRLRDLQLLEDLRDTHDLDPMFTLRFPDGATRTVVLGRPDDDGTFELIDGHVAAEWEAAAVFEETADGFPPEPDAVADTTRWLHEHGFATRHGSRGGKLSGSRHFERDDGWRVRYSCVLGAWSLELSPPGHDRFMNLHRLRPDQDTAWHETLPPLIRNWSSGSPQITLKITNYTE